MLPGKCAFAAFVHKKAVSARVLNLFRPMLILSFSCIPRKLAKGEMGQDDWLSSV
jgi:hypothetical protein